MSRAELGVARARVQRMFDEGAISIVPDPKDASRKHVRTGLCVRFSDALARVEE